MELEVCWSGATWRTFPAPQVGTAPDLKSQAYRNAHEVARRRVLDVLPDRGCGLTLQIIAAKAGISVDLARKRIVELYDDGRVEMQQPIRSFNGESRKLYRRAQRVEAAA